VKRWIYLALTVAAVAAAAYIYLHRQELGLVAAAADATEAASGADRGVPGNSSARIEWEEVDRTPDGFRAEMPEAPKEIEVPAYTNRELDEQVEMLSSSPDAQTTYSVVWGDDPPVVRAGGQSVKRTLDLARDGALARTQSVLVTESNATVQGFPARDFTGRNAGGGIFNARLVLTGTRLYMLIASFPSESARSEQDVVEFFNGFRLTASSSIPETLPVAPARSE